MQKILIAVEDEIFAEAIGDFVVRHRWSSDVIMQILHVVEPAVSTDVPAAYRLEPDREAVEHARELVQDLSDRLRRQLSVVVEETVVQGYPKEQILEMAKLWEADLIVLGSHGRHGVARFLLGSVSLAVTAHSPCSVAIVRLSREQVERMALIGKAEAVVNCR